MKHLCWLRLSHTGAPKEVVRAKGVPFCRGQRTPSANLTVCGSVLPVVDLDLGCCRKTAKACVALRLLPPAALPREHQ